MMKSDQESLICEALQAGFLYSFLSATFLILLFLSCSLEITHQLIIYKIVFLLLPFSLEITHQLIIY